jgi:hypothetical protein
LKAGTNEGFDAIGRGEAIAAHAVVLLRHDVEAVEDLGLVMAMLEVQDSPPVSRAAVMRAMRGKKKR